MRQITIIRARATSLIGFMASLGSILYWWHFAQHGRRIEVETDDDSIGGHFLHLLHGTPPTPAHVRATQSSLILLCRA